MSVRALFAGVSGLKNFQTQLDVIGNNIANSQTMGFKSSRVTFMSMMSQTLSAAAGPTATRGGVNAKQVGLGSMLGTIDLNFEQGNLSSTGGDTDIAIQGDGFFIISDGTNQMYTRNGAFNFDEEGNFVYGSGYKVMGLNAVDGVLGTTTEAIQIPLGVTLPAAATTSVDLVGNLDSSAEQVGTQLETEAIYAAEQSGQDTGLDGLLATGSANSFISGLTDGTTTVTVTTAGDSGIYTYSSSPVSNPAVSLTFNSLDDLAAAIAADISDISAATVDGNGAIELTSGAAGNSVTITSNLTLLQTALATANQSAGSFDLGVTTVTDEFSHKATSTDALVTLRNSSGTDLGILNGDTVTIDGAVGGDAITTASILVNGGTTLADFTNEIQSAFGITTSNNVEINNGKLAIVGDGGTNYALSDVNISTSGTRPNFDSIFDSSSNNYTSIQAAADNLVRSFTAYDSDGTAHTVSVAFNIRESSANQNRYVMDISSVITATGVADTSVSPSTGTIVCNADGSLASFDPATVTITPSGVGDPMVLTLDPGSLNGYMGIVMFEGDSTLGFRNVDGYASGDLQDVTITPSGIINGNFTNDKTSVLGQIQLGSFDNPQGLEYAEDNMFRETDNSGSVVIGLPNVGQNGNLAVGSLESSNVDLAEQFVNMILAQRGFQSTSKVITTADEVLQELVRLI